MANDPDVRPSPLRNHGIYTFQDREWVAVYLASDDQSWDATALVGLPFNTSPNGMLYLRHRDNVLVEYVDFQPVGTLADLTDTGRSDERDAPDATTPDQPG